MTISAWIFMLTVWGVVIGIAGYCFGKLLSSRQLFDVDLDEDEAAGDEPKVTPPTMT